MRFAAQVVPSSCRYNRELLCAGTEACNHMRTNGFIFIALGLTAVTMAGTPDYLPNVGPVGLQFAPARKSVVPVTLPALPAPPMVTTDDSASHPEPVTIPTGEPDPEPAKQNLMANPPVVVLEPANAALTNAVGPLIGPLVETNNVVTPQMFLRFFSPNPNGPSREAVIVAPPGFSPALPPPASSTATYSQPKP